MFASLLNTFAQLLPAFIFTWTFSGFFRAIAAMLLGDHSAQEDGFISLNPAVHMDMLSTLFIVGALIVVGYVFPAPLVTPAIFIALVISGAHWERPLPINPTNFKNPTLGPVITAIAGPIGSFTFAFLAMVFLRIFPFPSVPPYVSKTVTQLCQVSAEIGAFWGVLNFLPLPPFALGSAISHVMPSSMSYISRWLEIYGMLIFLGLLIIPGINDVFISSLHNISFAIKTGIWKVAFVGVK